MVSGIGSSGRGSGGDRRDGGRHPVSDQVVERRSHVWNFEDLTSIVILTIDNKLKAFSPDNKIK